MSVGWLVGRLVGRSVCQKKILLFSVAPGLIKGEDEDGARRKKAPSLLKSPKSHWGGSQEDKEGARRRRAPILSILESPKPHR